MQSNSTKMPVNFSTVARNDSEIKERFKYVSQADISPVEVKDIYENWAGQFDEDVVELPSISRLNVCQHVAQLLQDNKQGRIFDIAAGTGLIGKMLKEQGYSNIDGIDVSQKMLDEANKTGAYTNLYCDFLGKNRLDIDNDAYDVITTHGCFIPGHVTEDCFDELVRITKPGGHMIFSICMRYLDDAPEYMKKIQAGIQEFEDSGKWRVTQQETLENYFQTQSGLVIIIQKSL